MEWTEMYAPKINNVTLRPKVKGQRQGYDVIQHNVLS